jgi:hypothetical protein
MTPAISVISDNRTSIRRHHDIISTRGYKVVPYFQFRYHHDQG